MKYYNIYGENPKCGYWKKSPYQDNPIHCASRDDDGNCTDWKLADGSDAPSDYNGFFEDCNNLWQSYYETLSIAKICKNNSYENGCIPKYKSFEDIHGSHAGAPFPNQDRILKGSAIVLNDGMIIFTYQNERAQYIAIDVNGQKGPNKWGTDVYAVQPKMVDRYSPPEFYPTNNILEKGSLSVNDLLYK